MDMFLLRLRHFFSKKYVRIGLYILGGFLAFFLIMDNIVMPTYTKHGEAIPTPDVSKLRYEAARNKLRSEGFEIVRVEERFDDKTPSGYVIEQTPKPGMLVKSGRKIYVILSRGTRKYEMPNLVETPIENAKFKLDRVGLSIGERTYEPSDYYFEGMIIHQSIPAGVEVQRGAKIDLTISAGPISEEVITPLVEGKSLDAATEELTSRGLRIGEISYQAMDGLLPETVIRQSIQAGTLINKSEKIDLVVSTLRQD